MICSTVLNNKFHRNQLKIEYHEITQEILVIRVSLQRHLWFFYKLINDDFAHEKNGCWHSQISKYLHCNRSRESSIVLNHHDLEHIPSNN